MQVIFEGHNAAVCLLVSLKDYSSGLKHSHCSGGDDDGDDDDLITIIMVMR